MAIVRWEDFITSQFIAGSYDVKLKGNYIQSGLGSYGVKRRKVRPTESAEITFKLKISYDEMTGLQNFVKNQLKGGLLPFEIYAYISGVQKYYNVFLVGALEFVSAGNRWAVTVKLIAPNVGKVTAIDIELSDLSVYDIDRAYEAMSQTWINLGKVLKAN